jgi:hypothetical protein
MGGINMNRNNVISFACGVLLLAGFSSSAFATCTSSVSGTTATVTCNSASDQVMIGQESGNFWYHLGASTWGTDQYDWDSGTAGQQYIPSGPATINLNLGGGSLVIGGTASASVNPGKPADAVNGTVNWNGAHALVTFDSSASSSAATYTVNDDVSPYPTTVNSLTFHDSSAANITIVTGTAADTVNILSVFGADTITTDSSGGSDAVNIGNAANSVQAILGPVNVTNPPAHTTLFINNSGDATGRVATVTYTGVTGVAPAAIGWDDNDIASVHLTMGSGVDTVNVQSFYSSGGTLYVNGYNSIDTINFGGVNGMQDIQSPVSLTNSISFNILNFNDSGDGSGRVMTYAEPTDTTGSIAGLVPAPITWAWADHVNLTTGDVVDTVNVLSTTKPLNVNSNGGVDTVTVGNGTNGLQGINGSLYITNGPSFSNLVFDDSADASARTATYDELFISGSLAGVAPTTILWDWAGTVSLKMGAAADTVNVHSTYRPLDINGTNGNDGVVIGSAGLTQDISAAISVHNSSAWSTVVIDNSLDTNGRSGYFSATGITGLSPAPITWTQNDIGGVYAVFGSGDDVVHVSGSPTSSVTGGPLTYIATGDGTNEVYISGSGLGASSTNDFVGGTGNDYFDITSAVSTTQNVTAVNVFGQAPATFPGDELDYFAAATNSAPGTGILTPVDPNALQIHYNSIEHFDYNDVIFRDSFQ